MTHRKRMLRHGPRTGVLASSIGALIATGGLSTQAWGQDDDEEEGASADDTIIVTGTRIRRDDFSAAQATTVVTADDMRNLGVVSVADMVNQLPNNVATVTPEATADSPFYLGASIANLRGLNPAFGTRTLTLLDSRRMTPTNNAGSVDMNFIPSALIGRIETVTGGASATYGADAMAGVVNVILDDNIDNIRVDLNYMTSDEEGGDQYTFSFGTGAQFFDGRGRLTVGLDSSRQDAIEDCMTREVCRRGLGLLRNQTGASFTLYSNRNNPPIPGEPEWVFQEGHRYTVTPEGVVSPGANGDPFSGVYPLNHPEFPGQAVFPCATWVDGIVDGQVDTSACTSGTAEENRAAWRLGYYRFDSERNDVVPYFTRYEVTEEQAHQVMEVGDQTGLGLFFASLQGEGNDWATPYGRGRGIYEEVPIRPKTDRDNLFLRFTYELEGGIELGADLTYGETSSESLQNAARNNLHEFCIMPGNAYLAQTGPIMQEVWNARFVPGDSTDSVFTGLFGGPNRSQLGCRQAPFLAGTNLRRDQEINEGLDPNDPNFVRRYDYAPGMEIDKDWSALVDRRNQNESNATSLTLTANGSLFEGGSFTWDAYVQFGQTENRQMLSGWRAGRRWDMGLDSVIEGYDTNGDGVLDVPAWNIPDPSDSSTWSPNAQPAGSSLVIECGVNSQFAVVNNNTFPVGTPVLWGEFMRDRWNDYLRQALGETLEAEDLANAEANLAQVFEDMRAGCTPFNPFGRVPLTPEQQAYAFPTLFEGTDNDQTAFSLSFSGDAWRGIGDAGPMQMAAGLDWRENDTQNIADPNRFLGADFNFTGTSGSEQNVQRIYGDNWFGRTTTKEAWVEFDLPLLRDKPGANFLSFNSSFRRTENRSQRISGLPSVEADDSTREVDSWRASLQWQPVEIMRVRMTRSADTRAPSANELFATNSYATETGGELEDTNPWRFTNQNDAGFTESEDRFIVLQAGNARLQAERSVTETLGLVFQPVEDIPGLQVSVDYYQTTIEAGIREIDFEDTISNCGEEIGTDLWVGETVPKTFILDSEIPIPRIPADLQQFCPNIQFGPPDGDPNGTTDEELGQYIIRAGSTQGVGFGESEVLNEFDEPLDRDIINPFFDYTQIISVAESTLNEEDYISRGIDYSVSYFTQLDGGGSINARALFTRFLEQRVFLQNTFGNVDVSGQTGGSNIASYFGAFSANYSPTPRIRGNLFMTYTKNALSVTAQARYTGTGKLNKQNGWLSPGDSWSFQRYNNGIMVNEITGIPCEEGCPHTQVYDPNTERTIQNNDLPSWTTLNLNFNYDFGRSRFQLDRFESLSAYLNIENVGDRVPDFFSGTGAGGINTAVFSALGRQYRMGVRMEF